MPKTDIDYSNTIIYKITCKDPTVKDVYVGHTTNFVQRKHAHKQSCVNEKSCNYKCKLYETIRRNGGWNNWNMEIINFFKCRDHYEARIKEQEYFVSLNATLNSIEPLPKPKPKPIKIPKEAVPKSIVVESNKPDKPKNVKKIFCKNCNIECIKSEWETHALSDEHKTNRTKTLSGKYVCETCNFTCSKQSDYKRHTDSRKHVSLSNAGSKTDATNKPPKFNCEKCAFECSFKSNYDTHLSTQKHIKKLNANKNNETPTIHECRCGSTYKHYSSYYRHKKTCTYVPPPPPEPKKPEHADDSSENPDLYSIIQLLIKENQEIRNLFIDQNKTLTELVKKVLPNNSNNNNTTTPRT